MSNPIKNAIQPLATTTERLNPPYPTDTRAKGWRLELDYESARQSDTWALAKPELHPWLLMLLMVAWEQTPCGSLSNDDALISLRIGMSHEMFLKHKAVLLRGWQLANDGRLYHPKMTKCVLKMLEYRGNNALRQADHRAKQKTNIKLVTRDKHVTHIEVTTPEPEPESENKDKASVSADAKTPECPHQEIIALYHKHLPMLRQVAIWGDKRKSYLRSRWREEAERQNLEWWAGFFEYVKGCPLLIGNHNSKGHEGWQADLEWLVTPTNFIKVVEGKYQSPN